MFDWDRDYDGLIAAAPTNEPAPVAAAPRRKRMAFSMMILAGFLVLCSAVYVVSETVIFRSVLAQPDPLTILPFGGDGVIIDLLAMNDEQRNSFLTDLQKFSNADLLLYAATTRSDLEAAPEFMRPYLADALALIEHEMLRRGLWI